MVCDNSSMFKPGQMIYPTSGFTSRILGNPFDVPKRTWTDLQLRKWLERRLNSPGGAGGAMQEMLDAGIPRTRAMGIWRSFD